MLRNAIFFFLFVFSFGNVWASQPASFKNDTTMAVALAARQLLEPSSNVPEGKLKNLKEKLQTAKSRLLQDDAPAAPKKNTLALLSLIFGSLSMLAIVFSGITNVFFLALPFGIAALVLGILGLKKKQDKVMGILGIVFGGIGILLSLMLFSLVLALI